MRAGIWGSLREGRVAVAHTKLSWFSQREPHSLPWAPAPNTQHEWTSLQGTRGVLAFIIWEQRPQDFLFLLSTPSPEKLWVPTEQLFLQCFPEQFFCFYCKWVCWCKPRFESHCYWMGWAACAVSIPLWLQQVATVLQELLFSTGFYCTCTLENLRS